MQQRKRLLRTLSYGVLALVMVASSLIMAPQGSLAYTFWSSNGSGTSGSSWSWSSSSGSGSAWDSWSGKLGTKYYSGSGTETVRYRHRDISSSGYRNTYRYYTSQTPRSSWGQDRAQSFRAGFSTSGSYYRWSSDLSNSSDLQKSLSKPWWWHLYQDYLEEQRDQVDPAPEPQPEPQPEPAPDPAPLPQPDPEPAPDPVPAPQPDPEPAPDPTPDPVPAPEPTPTPDPEPTPQPTPDPAPVPAGLTADESEMLSLVNNERVERGLEPLQANLELVRLARMKAQDMIDKGYFAHQSPTYGSAFEMIKQAGISYIWAGENLAGAPTVGMAHTALMNSDGHRRNILKPEYTEIGIGIIDGGPYGKMLVQMFIGR